MNCRNTKYILLAAGTTGGWGYNNVFRKYAKTCIRENEGKTKGKIKYTAIVTVGGTKIFT